MTRARAEFVISADDKTARAFRQVENRLEATARAMRPVVIGATAVTAALGAATVRAVESGDALAKNARAANLTAETYQELRFAASQAGVEQAQFDGGMVRFTKRLGLADQGLGAAAQAYEKYGIATRNSNGELRSSEEVLREVADRIATLDSATERTAATTQFFGDDAARLRLLLEGGTAALDAQAAKARELGLVIDGSVLAQAEAASDELDRMQRIISAQLIVAFSELFPVVIQIGNAFAASVPKIQQFFAVLDEGSLTRLDGRIGMIRERMDTLREVISGGDVPAVQILGKTILERPGRDSDIGPAVRELEALEDVLAAVQEKRREIMERAQAGEADLINTEELGGGEINIPGLGNPEKNIEAAQQMFDRLYEVRLASEQRDLELEQVRRDRVLERLELQRQQLLDDETLTAETEEQFRIARENAVAASEARIQQIKQRSAQDQARTAQDLAQREMQQRQMAGAQAMQLLSVLTGQSRSAAMAMLAIQKAQSIASVLIQSKVAAMRALAELGPIAGPPVAAKFTALGYTNAALIAATGLAQAVSQGGGSFGSSVGGGAGGSFASQDRATRLPIAGENVQERDTNAAAVSITLQVNGTDGLARELGNALKAEITEGDFVMIEPGSRQAMEIRAG